MGLKQEWQRIEALTDKLHQAIARESAETNSLWLERQQLLEGLLNEATLASLSTRDIDWLRARSDELADRDRRLQETLAGQQKEIMQQLRQQAGNQRAAHAYRRQM